MAYGTFGAVPNTQAMPLVRTYYLDGDPAVAIANGANLNNIFVGAFIMPFNGDFVFQGTLRMYTSAAGVQAVAPVEISTASSPAPTWAAQSYWRTEGGSSYQHWHMPLVAQWENVASGTAVVIRAFVQNGTGGPSLQIDRASGIAIATIT